ncbi:MAG: winged helix-turn-helix transcriptional regulator [Planctomycetota bacterium]
MARATTTNGKTMVAVGEQPRWTFLTNHAHVLAVLHSDPDKVLRNVAAEVGITERAVQRIIQDLEDGGFIERERVGRQNHYRVLTKKPLRHPIESHRKIGDLLKLINK